MKFIIKILSIASLLFILTNCIIANQFEYVFKHLRIKDGLSQTTISDILQDKKGYIWFATSNGLNRYDGYKFKIYNNDPFDSLSLSDNSISQLFEDSQGDLWIGTNSGYLNKFNRKSETFERVFISDGSKPELNLEDQVYEFPITISRNNNFTVTSIAEELSGNLWIGTFGEGIKYYDRQNNKIYHIHHDENDPNSLAYDRVMKILIDSEAIVWVGTFNGGLNRLKNFELVNDEINCTFEKFMNDPQNSLSLSNDKVIEIFEDSDGAIWIGTYDGGLNKLDPSGKLLQPSETQFKVYKNESGNYNSLCNNTIMALEEDEEGKLWIGTFGGGLDELDIANNKFNHFLSDPLDDNSLADNDVISLKFDNSGILWIGTHLGEGISKLEKRRKKFGHITSSVLTDNSLSDNVVWSVIEDTEGYLWVGTYRGGLNRVDRAKNEYKVFNPSNSKLRDQHIRSLVEDLNSNIWVGTYSKGLFLYDRNAGSFNNIKLFKELNVISKSNQIQALIIDSRGRFWVGTFGEGLIQFEYDYTKKIIKNIRRFKFEADRPNSISDDRIYSLYEGRDSTIWVGTFGGGLCKFNENQNSFKSYKNDLNDRNSISDNRILSIYEDTNNDLWIGTYGGALNKFDGSSGVFLKYTEKSGLGSDVVYGILEDDKFNLWMSSDNGISKFNYREEIFSEYDLQDGLQSLEFSGGAYFKSKTGEMFFGGINGVNYFFPDSVESNFYIPPVVVTSFSISNIPQSGEFSQIELLYDQNFFSFEFSSLDYTNPEDNNYAYILEGLEKDWRFVDANRRVATYTNIEPGDYVFRVIGSNSDGIWNTEGTSIKLTILPPFWRTWWFITASLLFVIGLIYYVGTLRFRNLLIIEKLKSKIAADLHDNIGSGLTEISILSELAVRDKNDKINDSTDNYNRVSAIARDLIDGMSEIVWMINPKRDTLHELFVRLKHSYSELCSNLGISFKIDNLDQLKNIRLPMEYKQSIFLIFKEAINNSLKHSKCSIIKLDAELKGDFIVLTLADNGTGFDNSQYFIGNGIKNMKQRAEAIGGKVSITSALNEGTVIKYIGKIKGLSRLINSFKRK